MSQLANKIKPKIRKVIQKFPTKTTVFQNEYDSRNQPTGSQTKVCDIVGFYYEDSNKESDIAPMLKYLDKGETKKKKGEHLLVVIDEVTNVIREGDFFSIRGVKYKITELGNKNYFDIYFNFALERW